MIVCFVVPKNYYINGHVPLLEETDVQAVD